MFRWRDFYTGLREIVSWGPINVLPAHTTPCTLSIPNARLCYLSIALCLAYGTFVNVFANNGSNPHIQETLSDGIFLFHLALSPSSIASCTSFRTAHSRVFIHKNYWRPISAAIYATLLLLLGLFPVESLRRKFNILKFFGFPCILPAIHLVSQTSGRCSRKSFFNCRYSLPGIAKLRLKFSVWYFCVSSTCRTSSFIQ